MPRSIVKGTETVVCDCEQPSCGDPLCGYCDDDLFCPQCGHEIFELSSPNEPPSSPDGPDKVRRLWVYALVPPPQEDDDGHDAIHECRLHFQFWTRNRNRAQVRRSLDLNLEKTRLEVPFLFERQLEKVSEQETESVYSLKVSPASLNKFGSEWYQQINHDQGIEAKLLLAGACGHRHYGVTIFTEPEVRYEVSGPNVHRVGTSLCWSLGPEALQRLKIDLRPANCLLEIKATPSSALQVTKQDDAFVNFQCITAIPARKRLDQATPGTIVVEFDSTDWPENEIHGLWVAPDWAVLPTSIGRNELGFCRQAQGVLTFADGLDDWPLPLLYRGETASTSDMGVVHLQPRVFVNTGNSPLTLIGPEIAATTHPILPETPWIRVDWEVRQNEIWKPVNAPVPLKLDVGNQGRLNLHLDLGLLPQAATLPDPLVPEVTIVIEVQSQAVKRFAIKFRPIEERETLPTTLAIDFGTSNTFVAYVMDNNLRVKGAPRVQIVPVRLAAGDQEQIPTALFFRKANDTTDVIIGDEALVLGEKTPTALFTGLKKALISDEELEKKVLIEDAAGRTHFTSSKRDLIVIYLLRVLRLCEDRLRKKVMRVCFSHPANYGPHPRAAMQGIIHELKREWDQRHKGNENQVSFHPLEIDEASAVAFHFVLDDIAYAKHIVPLIDKRVADKSERRFYVASIDMGGGSTDLSLVEFTKVGDMALRYSSVIRGIGGDETLGGENFTEAVFGILRERLIARLERTLWEFPLAAIDADRTDFDPVGWANARLLKNLADTVKKVTFGDPDATAKLEIARTTFQAKARVRPRVGGGATTLWADLPDLATAFDAEFPTTSQWVTAEQIYEYPFTIGRSWDIVYDLKHRLEDCLNKIATYLERARKRHPNEDPTLDFLVLAGASSRIPLIKEVLQNAFPTAHYYDEALLRPKEKVAAGLARYYRFQNSAGVIPKDLAVASEYTHADIIWAGPGELIKDGVFIESGTKLDTKEDILFEYPDELEALFHADENRSRSQDSFLGTSTRYIVVARDAAPKPEILGYFDLSKDESQEEGSWQYHLRLRGIQLKFQIGKDEKKIDLWVELTAEPDKTFGPWSLIPGRPAPLRDEIR